LETNTKTFGYARVSTSAQSNDRQLDALTAAGIPADHIYTDKISGARQSRPGLDALLKVARRGDNITVASLDRLGRTALHVMQTIADLDTQGIQVRSLKDSENMSGATGDLMRGLMILVAEWERKMNAERVAETRASRAARAAAGEQVAGRPRTALSASKLAEVKKWDAKGRSASEIAKLAGISRASAYRALAEIKK
jgi:DNA invertase Pin-like site-specific DNA recombinase